MAGSIDTKQFISYDQPPINEVVCGVLFEPVEALVTAHIGLLWERFQPDYPFSDDVAPLPTTIEVFNTQDIENTELTFTNIPLLPRVLFISSDETKIIQVQRDRLIHNWRKTSLESEYPRYSSLIETFQGHLKTFDNFIREAELGEIKIRQYELSYVNQISQGHAWETLEDLGKIFPDFRWRTELDRSLSKPQNIDWDMTFDLPEEVGRLHISIKSAVINNDPIILFVLTVRGVGKYKSLDLLESWFDLAHEWIVKAFADLTDEKIQTNIWKRRDSRS